MGFSRQEYWKGLPFPSPGMQVVPSISREDLRTRSLKLVTWGKERELCWSRKMDERLGSLLYFRFTVIDVCVCVGSQRCVSSPRPCTAFHDWTLALSVSFSFLFIIRKMVYTKTGWHCCRHAKVCLHMNPHLFLAMIRPLDTVCFTPFSSSGFLSAAA